MCKPLKSVAVLALLLGAQPAFGDVVFSGISHAPKGAAVLLPTPNQLTVGNLGSSGQDGVEMTLPYTSGWEGHWQALETPATPLPVGAYVQSQVYGNAGSISNGLLGSWRLTKKTPGTYQVTADYSPLGATTVTVQVYNGTALVASRTHQIGLLGTVTGCVLDDHHGNPVPTFPFGPFGSALTFSGPPDPAPLAMILGDGTPVTGDRLVILPEGAAAVSSLTRVNVLTSGVPQLIVTSEAVESSVGTYHNAAMDYVRAQGLWGDGVTPLTSNNVTQITNSIGAYLKSVGFDPAATDAASAAVLQGFSQANLYYTTASGTYFGAPVTSDQFVPYLMARLQTGGAVSADFVAKVTIVNNMVVSRADSAAIMSYVASSFLGTFSNAADNHAAEVFVDTYTKSYAYWTDPAHLGGSGGGNYALAPGDGVIIADAAGALYGLLLGPVGSILYGAAASIIANNASIAAPAGNVGYNGLNQVALGTAALDVTTNRLIVSNLGSSGQDGVSIPLPYTSAWDGQWLPLDDNNTLPVGAYVQSQVFGNAGTLRDGLLGSWRLTKQGTGHYAVTADYSPLGSTTVTVQVYNGMTLVATRSGQSGQLAIVNGCVEDDHHGNPVPTHPFGPFGGALTMFGPLDMTLADGATVTGDRLVILPEGATAVSSLTRVNVRTSGVPRLVITSEGVQDSVGTYHNAALDYLRAQGLWMDGVTRLTSNNVTQVTSSIGDYLKSVGFDPATTDAASASVVQSLSQAGLLYTNAGGTYFGAPVTSDQFIPYIMARMQTSGAVSAAFVAKVNVVNSMVVSRADSAAIMSYVASSFLGAFTSAADNHAAEVFVDTYTKSYAYWNDPAHQGGGSGGGSYALKDGDGVILADAAGALYGLLLGPVGSILYGAGFSLIANHASMVAPAGHTGYNGLNQVALGTAALDVQLNRLIVSNLGSSGQDGVSISLPLASGWEAHWLPLDPTGALPVGAFIQSQAFGTAGTASNGLLGSWKLTKAGTGLYAVTADFSQIGSSTVTLQVFSGSTLVTTLAGQSGALAIVNGCVDDDHWGNPTPTGPYGLPGPFGGALTFQDPRTFTFLGGATAQGDRLVILPEGGAAVSSLSQTTVLASGIPQISVDEERHFSQYAGLLHGSLGQADLGTTAGQLTVSNLGSSGQDGVEIDLPYTSAWEGHWQQLETAATPLPLGASIQSQVFGNAGAVSNGLLGSWTLTKKGTGNYVVTADYTPLGSTTVTVQVYNGTALVATRTHQSGALGAITGCALDDHHGNPVPGFPFGIFGCALTFTGPPPDSAPQSMVLADGTTVTGDRFVILPEGATAVSSLTRVNVLTSGVPQLIITSEAVQSSVGTYHNAAMDYVGAHGLWMDGVTRFTSGNVTQVTNSIGDYLKSVGFDPAATDATAASVLQGFSQANLFYTDGGVTYFGAPVTSDQLVPYLLARLQTGGAVSAAFVAKVNVVNTMIVNRADSAAIMSYVANSFLGSFSNAADNHAAEVFVDTYTNSYTYWTDPSHQGGQSYALKDGDKVIIADAMGALSGLILGPIASIIEGAVVSLVANHSSMVVPGGTVGFGGLNQTALGAAALDVSFNQLTVSNLGSSGQDGVSITLPYTSAWDGQWLPLDDNNTLPVGAYVQSQVFGNAGTVSSGLLGSWRMTKQGAGHYAVTADYSPLGSATVTVQVYNGMTLVATRSGQTGQLAIVSGCVEDDHHGNPVPTHPFGPFGGALTMFGPLDMTLADGATVTGDRLVILPEGATAVSSLTRVNVQTSGVPRLVITSEGVQDSVGTYHNAALDYLRAHGLWLDGVTHYTSANVTQVATSIGDYLKSVGFDPAATDAATAAVLQGLSQANLYYTAGGVTYFGAPVTSDQFIPYLMARMQTSGTVSAAFVAKVNIVNSMVVSRADSAAILSYVSSSFLGAFTSAADNHAAEVFVDTYTKSYAYWNDPAHQGGGTGGGSYALKPGDGVIIADAAGALYGLLLGPVGSILYGAAASLIANNSSIVAPPSNTGYNGLNQVALGTAALDVKLNRLIVSNLGSSGQDGVSITLLKAASWEAHWLPLDPTDALPGGAYIQSQAYGTAGTPTNGLLGSWKVTKKGTANYQVTADFSPLGCTTVTLQVFNGSTLVTTLPGQSGALAVVNGCVDDDHWGNPTPTGPYGLPGPFGGALTFQDPRTFTFLGGATALGDRLVIVPEGGAAVSSLTQTTVLASGIPQISIDQERHFVEFAGLLQGSLGQAGLGVTGGQLTVGNLGSSGQDGVEIELGAPSQRKLDLFYQVPADDGTLAFTGIGTVGTQADQVVGKTTIAYSGSTKTVSFDYSSIGAATYTLRIYNGKQLVHESHGHPSGPCVIQDRFIYKKIALDDVHLGWWEDGPDEWNGTFWIPTSTWHDGYTSDTSQDTSTQRVIGGPTVLGNLVLAIPESPALVVGSASRARIQTSGQITSLQFSTGSLSSARSTATALGQATFAPDGTNLTIGNLGSSGQDGVSVALPDTSAWEGHWQPLETAASPLPLGAYVQSQVFGNAGSVSDGLLGTWRLTKQAAGRYAVTADYSPLGSATVTVQVYNGKTLVATRSGQSGQLGIINGCVEDDHHGNPVPTRPFGPFGGALTMFGPLDMTLADGALVTGDRFVILPEGAAVVNSLTRVNVQTSGVPQLVLTSESVQPTVGALHNAALDYLLAQGLWMDGVTRFTNGNVTQVTSSIGAYLKSMGFDPAETDAANAAVLQGMSQANLFYTSGGVSYFGAPVTSDQFIPYLMARMQTSGTISADFVAKVNVVNDMVLSRADSSSIMAYVASSFIGTFASAADNHAAEVFVDTYTNSYAYWNDPAHQGGTGGGSYALKDGDKVIIADAMGALSGLILGPIASIIEGAVVSLVANHSSMVAPSGTLGFGGLNQVAVGTAALDIQFRKLTVSNLGSSGQDGVSIDLGKAAHWEAHWQPLDPTGSLPAGAYVQSEIVGATGKAGNGPLGSWRLTKLPNGSYAVTADFSQLGASTVTLQVFNGTTLVTTLTGQSGLLATVNGCVDDDHWGNPTPSGPYGLPGRFGGALTFLGPDTFTFAGGATAQGDRLAILPEGGAAVSSLSQAHVLASGVPQISIDLEQYVLQNPAFSDWAAAAAAAAGITVAELGGPLDDFNHTGFSNLVKYAFGIDPSDPSGTPVITQGTASLTVGTSTAEYLTLACEHPADRSAVPVAQASDDLVSWTPAVLVSSVTEPSGLVLDTWRAPQPKNARPAAVLRFQVTLSE